MVREIAHIVVHCSASANGKHVSAEMIDEWHAARDFQRKPEAIAAHHPELSAIGYHYVISVNGAVQSGRAEAEIGAHVAGSNAKSIGICMIGIDKFTKAQWDALANLVEVLRVKYPSARVCGHRDFSPDKDGDGVIEESEWTKTCPGFDVEWWMANGLSPKAAHVLGAA